MTKAIVALDSKHVQQPIKYAKKLKLFLITLLTLRDKRTESKQLIVDFVDNVELCVDEIERKRKDFSQINTILQLIRLAIKKENQYIIE